MRLPPTAAMFGFYGLYDEHEPRNPWGEAAISQRAQGKLDQAKELIHNFIALADTTAGPVSAAATAAYCCVHARAHPQHHSCLLLHCHVRR